MQHDELAYVVDILNSADHVGEFISGFSKRDFLGDLKTRSAVIYQIMIIGEASSRLSVAFREANSQVPWRTLINLRNMYIHAYGKLNLDRVWRAATNLIPEAVKTIRETIPIPPPAESNPGESSDRRTV